MIDRVRYGEFCVAIRAVVQQYPTFSSYSWGRSVKHNADVGGNLQSQHMEWTALDGGFDPGTEPNGDDFRAFCASVGLVAIAEQGPKQVVPTAQHDHWHLQLPRRP